MAQTIDKLLVEISANADLLRAEIRKAGGDMKSFGAQTATTAKDVGNLQQRYARAALGVASATESIARQGRVTGESMKQVLTHGANMVAMFGLGGPIVGAVAIALAAIVSLFARASEEAKRTEATLTRLKEAARTSGKTDEGRAQEDLQTTQTRLVQVSQQLAEFRKNAEAGLAGAAQVVAKLEKERLELLDAEKQAVRELAAVRQASGDREIAQLGQLLTLGKATAAEKQRAKDLEAALRAELARTTGEDEKSKQRRLDLQTKINALTEHERRAATSGERQQKQAEQTADALAAVRLELQSIAAQTGTDPLAAINARFDKLAEKLSQLERDAPTAKTAIAAVRQEVEETRQAQIALARTEIFTAAQRAGIEAIGSALAVAKLRLQEAIAELEKKGVAPAVVEEAKRLGEQLIDAGEFARALGDRLAALNESRLAPLKKMAALSKERELAEGKLATITGTGVKADEARAVVRAEIAKIDGEIVDLQEQNAAHLEASGAAAESMRVSLAGVLNVAFGITSALFGSEHVLTRMISATGQIAAGFQDIAELQKAAAKANQALSLASALPAIGGILGGAVAIASLAGLGRGGDKETPEERAQREATERLTRALQELRDELGDLGRLPISGRDAAAIAGTSLIGTRLVNQGPEIGDVEEFFNRSVKDILADLRRVGVSMGDLRKVAQEFNLTLSENPTWEELEALQRALRELDRAIFPDTFQGKIAEMEAMLRAIGESDPLKQLIARIAVLTGPQGAPAFAAALKDLDLGTGEGRAEAIKRLRDLLGRVSELENADFGGLLPQEFVDQLLVLIESLRELDPDPLEQFADKLAILRQRFEVEGTTAAQRVAALVDLFAESFEELAFLKDAGAATDIEAVKKRFQEIFAAAAADGVIDDKENAILDAFRELLAAMETIATDAAERVRKEAEVGQDLRVRELRAQGRDAEADALERQLAREEELAALREAGLSDAIIEQLKYVQALEEAARAAAAAAAAERQRQALLEEIEVQLLRARGDEKGADEFELERRQRERRDKAKELDLSEAQLEKLEELERLEREQLAARFAEQAPTGGGRGGASLPDRQTGVQSITERSTFEVIDVLRSQLLIEREQEIHLRGILAALGSRAVSPIPVPALTPGALAGAAPGSVNVFQNFNITVEGSGLSPDELVTTMRAQLAPHLRADARRTNNGLGNILRQDLRGRGRGEVP